MNTALYHTRLGSKLMLETTRYHTPLDNLLLSHIVVSRIIHVSIFLLNYIGMGASGIELKFD